jgi:hypothetical protein
MVNLTRNDRKYWLSEPMVMASCTLSHNSRNECTKRRRCKNRNLSSLLYASASIIFCNENTNRSSATLSLSFMTTTTLSTIPYVDIVNSTFFSTEMCTTCQNQLFTNRFHSTSNIFIQCWVTRLKNGRIILLPAYKKVCGIYLSHI